VDRTLSLIRRLYLRMAANRRRAQMTMVINMSNPATKKIHQICAHKLVESVVTGSVHLNHQAPSTYTVIGGMFTSGKPRRSVYQ
jgi:hypothetical protein